MDKARIASILRKAEQEGAKVSSPEEASSLLTSAEEWDLIKTLGDYSEIIGKAAEKKEAA